MNSLARDKNSMIKTFGHYLMFVLKQKEIGDSVQYFRCMFSLHLLRHFID